LNRKALKKYNPIPTDMRNAIKWVEDEIEILKKISSPYLINYLDSFSTIIEDSEFKCYHVVNNYYQVNFYFSFNFLVSLLVSIIIDAVVYLNAKITGRV